jgi:Leucine-rich repeat (LRR) protein
LEYLPRLSWVNLEANRLTSLPGSLAMLKTISELNIAGNQLTEECLDALATIPNLKTLNLARNRI